MLVRSQSVIHMVEKHGRRRLLPPGFTGDLASRYGVVMAWILVIVVFSILQPETFATWGNFQTIFGSQAVLLILALGLLPSLRVGEIDLSFAGVMTVAIVLVGYLSVDVGWPIGAAAAAALLAGAVAGFINAFLVVNVGLNCIVVTLGTGTLLGGLAVAINLETVTGISPVLVDAVRTQVLGLPLAFWYGVLLTTLVWYVFKYTPLGRYLQFSGVGPEVARLSGIRVDAIRFGSLMTASIVAALAGVVLTGTLGAANPRIGLAYLLPAFSAAYLGSTVISPGRFNAWGTFVAVYFLVTGITGLELLGLSGWISDVFYGASLVLAITFSHLLAQFQERRRDRRVASLRDDPRQQPTEASTR